jgi:hypothetical protein
MSDKYIFKPGRKDRYYTEHYSLKGIKLGQIYLDHIDNDKEDHDQDVFGRGTYQRAFYFFKHKLDEKGERYRSGAEVIYNTLQQPDCYLAYRREAKKKRMRYSQKYYDEQLVNEHPDTVIKAQDLPDLFFHYSKKFCDLRGYPFHVVKAVNSQAKTAERNPFSIIQVDHTMTANGPPEQRQEDFLQSVESFLHTVNDNKYISAFVALDENAVDIIVQSVTASPALAQYTFTVDNN